MLDLDESMDCDAIFEKVFDYLDDNEDGQIPRSIVSSIADGITAEIRRLYTNNQDLKEENANLKGEVAKLKEWAERMQQFCNMSEEDRKAELERIRVDGNFTQLMDDLSAYTKFFFGGANLPLF